jgi:glucose-1-phosphate thymidylyltransferase
VPGLYIFDNQISEISHALKPSPRGELEITDVIREYLRRGTLFVEPLGRGIAWLDTGTPESLMEASTYIATLEHRQGVKVACLEEIAFYMHFIEYEDLQALAQRFPRNSYRAYLESLPSSMPRFKEHSP